MANQKKKWGLVKPVAIWKVWSLAWLVSITAAESSRIRAVALYPLYWFVLAVVWAQGGLYSVRNDVMVSVISPKERKDTTARFVAIFLIILLPLAIVSIWIQGILDISTLIVLLGWLIAALLFLAPGIFHEIGSKSFTTDMKNARAIREWMKRLKIKPYDLPHFVTRQNILTPEDIRFFLDVYCESIPSGVPVAILAEHEELAAICQSELGLARLFSKEQPTMAFAGFKQEQGAASI